MAGRGEAEMGKSGDGEKGRHGDGDVDTVCSIPPSLSPAIPPSPISASPRLLLIDNYDSFVHNLARYLRRLGHETMVVRNDAISVSDIQALAPAAIVISPGPCTPREAGVSLEVVQRLWTSVPILGVCLGHQTIAAAWGAKVVRAKQPMHGRTSPIAHTGRGVFAGLPSPFNACRYHSLVVDEATLPSELMVTARTSDGTVMGIEHHDAPVFGVQFHPEAILTEHGYSLLANFLRRAGLPVLADWGTLTAELNEPPLVASPLPTSPVTF